MVYFSEFCSTIDLFKLQAFQNNGGNMPPPPQWVRGLRNSNSHKKIMGILHVRHMFSPRPIQPSEYQQIGSGEKVPVINPYKKNFKMCLQK
jgi:hypothetical protein